MALELTNEKPKEQIYVLKITLRDTHPPVWRRVQVPNSFTFAQLHTVIQEAMDGWADYHLHGFAVYYGRGGPVVRISGKNEFDYENDDLDENTVKLWEIFSTTKTVEYTYDFGDNWEHIIKLEDTIDPVKGQVYPKITSGKMCCPPEDVGSIPGYYNLIKVMEGPDCEEKKELLEWLGYKFDAKKFNIKDVEFSIQKKYK